MDKKTTAIIILVLIIIGFAGYFAYNYLGNKFYQQGYNQATGELILKINQDGQIPVIYYNNQTGNSTIKWQSIQQICGSSNG